MSWETRSEGSTNWGGGGGSERSLSRAGGGGGRGGAWGSSSSVSTSLSSDSGAPGEKPPYPLFFSCACLPLDQEVAIGET